ncbi:hypothetical protein KI688_008941 [Linnemannia hyalina]|uniref:RNI-like protein n=1 Tax=Linnemannia hyalina TaxID=64524 RepID=A0A9P8BM24_9FUNG|nr:hypothetical protein KI688_008941 [Linnemannia hyalina]
MEDTQSFHLIETMDTVEITLNHVKGQNIVYWEDIEQVFPGVKRVRNGKSVIKFLRGSDQQSINHCSRLVQDVVLSTSVEPTPAPVSKAISLRQIAIRASRETRESEIVERFISLLAPEVRETVRASPNIYQAFAEAIKDGHGKFDPAEFMQELSGHFQELKDLVVKNSDLQEEVRQLQEQVLSNQKEIKQLQQRALNQLAVLQSRVQAVLTQTYELHEYPIPRLFVVLPQDPSGWDTMSPFSNKFRLYFLCECGEHTKSINSKTKIPHHIHLAKHEGYEIARPKEFFQQYGPYVLTILKMLKFGVTVAGVAMPAFSQLISPDVLGQTIDDLKQLQDALGLEGLTGQVDNKEALEGADLRKLETFLKDKDGNKVLGNLYRTVTDEGHVKWVCMDHYRENYNKTAAEAFRRAVDAVGGSFDENNGQVKVELRSRVMAEQFYSALGKARYVYELVINLALEGTKSDLEALADALKTSNVSILHLNLQYFRPNFSSKLQPTSARYGVLCRIMKHPNMKMIHIVLPSDLISLSIFPSKPPSHLRKLSFEMVPEMIKAKELGQLSETLKTNSSLTTLNLERNSIGDNGAQALSEALKTNSTLTTLNLLRNSIGDNGAQALSEALKTNSTLTISGV